MFEKILVPLDGSMLSEKALPYALRLVKQLDATLIVLRVVEREVGLLPITNQQEAILTRTATEYLTHLEHTLTDPQNELAIPLPKLQTYLVYSQATKEISNFAAHCHADLIVMTTHARSGLGRLVLGSVAAAVVHQNTTPVMLVRPFETRYDQLLDETLSEIGEPLSPQCFSGSDGRILLTLDGTLQAETALEPALELATRLKASLYLTYVNRPVAPLSARHLTNAGYDEAELLKIQNVTTTNAYNYLDYAASLAHCLNIPCITNVTFGETPALEISRYADEIEAELIIMATHAPGELARAFSGSVAESVVQHSHRPVLLVQTGVKSKETERVIQTAQV